MSDPKSNRFLEMTIPEIVSALSTHAEPGSLLHEEIKGALSAVLITRLSDAIDRHEKAASRLAMQVLLLNIIFGLFTIAGTVWAFTQLFK